MVNNNTSYLQSHLMTSGLVLIILHFFPPGDKVKVIQHHNHMRITEGGLSTTNISLSTYLSVKLVPPLLFPSSALPHLWYIYTLVNNGFL